MATEQVNVSRRDFLIGSATAGVGLSLGFYLPFGAAHAQNQAGDAIREVNAWVVIKPDDTVVIRIARSEMGQGTLTGLAQLVAEELECDWSKVTTEYPTPGQNLARDRVWRSFSTGGSQGIRGSHQYVREGGAVARSMLIEAAAEAWGVPMEECSAANSVITHGPTGRTVTYGQVATAAADMIPPVTVPLKDPKDWKIVGKPVKRLDTLDKLTGKQVFGADLSLPGMLNAAIKACPVFGGSVRAYDANQVMGMPGVRKAVKVDDATVAVIAETWWQAKTALDALPVVWDDGPNSDVSSESIADWLRDGLSAAKAFVGNRQGDVDDALTGAVEMVEAVYSYPYQNHATMEPMNATARWTTERCEVWCPTQNGEAALEAAIAASGLAPAQCDVYKIHLGGGFGRRGAQDYVTQAVNIAKQMPGTPIKMLWSREEDMTHGKYHPTTQAKLVGGLDKDGNLTALRVRISGQSILASVRPNALNDGADMVTFQGFLPEGDHAFVYSVPNLLVDHAMRNPPVPPGFWRGVNINQNAIYLECFVDELAHASGQDPLAFRRRLMANDHPNALAVLNAVAHKVGWDAKPADGVHRGLAVCKTFASYVAACAEVSVTNGQLKVHRIVAATDSGYAVNPQQIEAQIEGSFMFGLSAMLYGECTIKGGRVEQENFNSYPSMTIAEMPQVESIVMPSGGFWGGVGEPTIAVAAPAVLNAIFAATGRRVRNLPLKNTDLRVA
ncbi:xanthine dehydrogenase family protein molybdopterin-binding subunit [Thiosocius teredinicola]|uniref:xanthine dehydrogenase family protein molybdopterin-binding subunit n=1 Tax=Thiosocius teredinicola TaxID=1973002 RepID=UPI0009913574